MTLSSELRSVDYFGQDFSIRLDGKEVWTDYPETTYFYMTEDWEPGIAYEKGEWEYEISASKLKVDELDSRTHCLMRFKESDSTEANGAETSTSTARRRANSESNTHPTTLTHTPRLNTPNSPTNASCQPTVTATRLRSHRLRARAPRDGTI